MKTQSIQKQKQEFLNLITTSDTKQLFHKFNQKQKDQALNFAIKYKLSCEKVKLMIENGSQVNKSHKHEYLLHTALKSKTINFDLFEILLKHGANPNYPNKFGQLPLHMLCLSTQFKNRTFKKLLNRTTSLDYKSCFNTERGDTPLHLIIKNSQNIDAIQWISEHNCDITLTDTYKTCFDIAVERELPLDKIKQLITIIKKKNSNKKSLMPKIYLCYFHKKTDILEYLASEGVSLLSRKHYEGTLLEKCCTFGKIEMINKLIELGKNSFTKEYYTTCLLCCAKGTLTKELFQKFVKSGANLIGKISRRLYFKSQEENILSNFCYRRNVNLDDFKYFYNYFKHWIKQEKNTEKNKFDKIIQDCFKKLCSKRGNLVVIKYLISQGIDPKKIKFKNGTAVYHGLLNEMDYETVKYFVDNYNLEIEPKNLEKTQSVIESTINNFTDIKLLKYLIAHKASLTLRTNNSYHLVTNLIIDFLYFPSHIRSFHWGNDKSFNKIEFLEFALKHGLDPNLPCPYINETPLMQLAKGRFKGFIKPIFLLLKYGANPWLEDSKHQSFFDLLTLYNRALLKMIEPYFTIVKDFRNLLKREENTDIIINTIDDHQIKIHSLIIKLRLTDYFDNSTIDENENYNEKMKNIIQVLKGYKKNKLQHFLKWTYTGYIFKHSETIEKNNILIAKKIGLNRQEFLQKSSKNGLVKDLKKLYKHTISMGFILLARNYEKDNQLNLRNTSEKDDNSANNKNKNNNNNDDDDDSMENTTIKIDNTEKQLEMEINVQDPEKNSKDDNFIINERINKIDTEYKNKKKGRKIMTQIKSHRLILQTRSNFFRQMFLTFDRNQESFTDFRKQKHNSLNMFIKYLYTDKIPGKLSIDILNELRDSIEYYQLSENPFLSYQINEQFSEINETKTGKTNGHSFKNLLFREFL
ncbi:ankyrin repeat-containing protein [Anaeramoeba flamelloides]|uniref:Ankyrin repeat-containing protein n=1 Tax=Anaeramoeba flamelloides TaxID=1746091 RepID=A0ABQ8XFV2_9EUKA|nr:ankyrin repeat-containing protein [Anaeramoeba flamelloides]